ncbi:type I-E CRISPR-associated protein Cse1/CasA [Leptonema illini]|uniref:CRISPR-associated protein, Cse1 family n=1 Tax=Leptonema illini DSM 21528 TaxID=929563 RepID=H2CA14_9LEPT|nr:type I-E CRISPR-associated protein Cse1/CasA [Leptonema illini]EHQ05138.1 CRISPR-associated protein, Cse1 family [Leptonema illini DSM 21528]
MNLLKEAWIPVLRRSGRREIIRPAQMVENLESDPVVRLDAVRPDFNGALIQFFIGLLQTVLTPAEPEDWEELFLKPPAMADLESSMAVYATAFELDGPGPRFFQDLELAAEEGTPIGSLLIEAPGANTIKNNADHFVKRNQIQQMCPACTATALLTLQTNAPSGGAGHRTSLRGGGPLTTIVLPQEPKFQTLWHTAWLNVLLKEDLSATQCKPSLKALQAIFPWMAATKLSKTAGTEILGSHIHPAQTFWATPRRIRLFPASEEEGACSICNAAGAKFYRQYATVPHGANYAAGILHPLSPYYNDKGVLRPVHPQPGGFTYRHWPDFVIADVGEKERAIVVRVLGNRLRSGSTTKDYAIYAFGYDMDNMKARCWYEARMPYWPMPDEALRKEFAPYATAMADVANDIASNTRKAVQLAFFDSGASVRGDLDFVKTEFWQSTEPNYYDSLREVMKVIEDPAPVLRNWLKALQKVSMDLYDHYSSQISLDEGKEDGMRKDEKMPRVVRARRDLLIFNRSNKFSEKLGISAAAKGGMV